MQSTQGEYLMQELKKFPQLKNLRGRGLMIGFDVPDEQKDLRKNLLWNQHIFTGEAKPNTIRLLAFTGTEAKRHRRLPGIC